MNMNAAHIHLLINHVPIVTLIFGFCILAIGRILRNESSIRVALGLLIFGGFAGVATYYSGGAAAEFMKSTPSFPEKIVHEHALAASFGIWATIITGVAALVAFYFSMKKGAIPKWLLIVVFIINFWAITVIARTSYLGGQISHPEIRSE